MTFEKFINNWTKIKEYFCFNIIGLSQNHLLGSALSEVEGKCFGDTMYVHIQLLQTNTKKYRNYTTYYQVDDVTNHRDHNQFPDNPCGSKPLNCLTTKTAST